MSHPLAGTVPAGKCDECGHWAPVGEVTACSRCNCGHHTGVPPHPGVSGMTAPSPEEISRYLDSLIADLDLKVLTYDELCETAAAAKRDAEVAEAEKFLTTEGPMDIRRQAARLYAADARFKAEAATGAIHACREAIKALQLRIEVGRTAAANVRAELSATSAGGGWRA